ncbi:MAG: YcaO-like family protein [Bdellovibrio sp.]|nr:YcaO-like family protein [Bdellovibrio sp.]
MQNKILQIIDYLKINNSLNFFENNYIKSLNNKWFDFSAEILLNGQKYEGRGIDDSSEIAITKAIYEAIERTLLEENDIDNSNGVAISNSIEFSKESAKNELIERHLFLRHWINLIGYNYLSNEDTKFFEKIFYTYFPSTINVNFFETESIQSQKCVLCIATGEKHSQQFGAVIGLSAKPNQTYAIKHSFFEMLSTTSHDFNLNTFSENITLDQFKNIKDITFNDHGKLAKNFPYYKNFSFLFNKNNNTNSFACSEQLNNIEFNYKILKIPFPFDLGAVRCTSPQLLKLYTGFAERKFINNYPHFLD